MKSFVAALVRRRPSSLPVRGAWVEISAEEAVEAAVGRSPCGERGLKLSDVQNAVGSIASLPVRGAWVEIDKHAARTSGCAGRSPCGERGLK